MDAGLDEKHRPHRFRLGAVSLTTMRRLLLICATCCTAFVSGCQPVLDPPTPEPVAAPVIEERDIEVDAPIVKEEVVARATPAPTPFVPESEKPAIVLPPPPHYRRPANSSSFQRRAPARTRVRDWRASRLRPTPGMARRPAASPRASATTTATTRRRSFCPIGRI
jgi:hypothetical protein